MKAAYSYTILRYVHDTTTGEFENVGVAIFAPQFAYASALCRTTYGRLVKTFPGMDGESFKSLPGKMGRGIAWNRYRST